MCVRCVSFAACAVVGAGSGTGSQAPAKGRGSCMKFPTSPPHLGAPRDGIRTCPSNSPRLFFSPQLLNDSQASQSKLQFHFGLFIVKALTLSAVHWAGAHHPARPILGLFYFTKTQISAVGDGVGLAPARVSPWASCLGEKRDCERQLTGSSAHSAASLAWKLEDKGEKELSEKDDLGVNKTHSQNFFNWEHQRTVEAASSSRDRVLFF